MLTFDRIARYWLPGVILLTCVAMYVISPDIIGLEAAAMLFGGGSAVILINWMQRLGFAGDVDRDKEAETREFFTRYGMWPGQASPELIAEAREQGMLEHVVIKPRRTSGA